MVLSNGVSIRQIFGFPSSTFIENIHVRPNGHLLLSTFTASTLYTIDPTDPLPSPKTVVSDLPGSTALTGIATIGPDRFAVSGGIHEHFKFAKGMHVYVLSVPGDSDSGILLDTITVPDARGLNGMAALPAMPHVVLSADSLTGCIYRINTLTRVVDVAFADPLLGPGPTFQLGANGVKIFNGYLYFTNSGQGFFARVKINDDGSKAGDIEVVARLPGVAGMGMAYDDFTFDSNGNAYVTMHSYRVQKITPDGTQTTFAGGDDDTVFKSPTSAATSQDGKSIYVATAGKIIDGKVYGGQVIELAI